VGNAQTVSLQVPGTIAYREVVLDAVSAAAALALTWSHTEGDKARLFCELALQSVGDAFDNIVLQRYRDHAPGMVRLQLELEGGLLCARLEELDERGPGVDEATPAPPP
jgi:hypothetical protein